jgi:hypothetical protein
MRTQDPRRAGLSGALAALGVVLVLSGCAPQNPAITGLEPVAFPEPVAVEPGSELEVGDAVWVEQASAGTTTLLGVAVLDIVEGDPTVWMNYENGPDMLDLTPYFVIVQREWLEPDELWDISLYPVLSDGTPGYLMETDSEGAISPATCESLSLGLPRLDDPLRRFDCLLTAAPVGSSVTSVYYDGTFARENENLDPTRYLEAPVSWSTD